jgi:trehalose 6-phosphate phosphatase
LESVHLALVSGRPAVELGRLAEVPDGTLVIGSHGAEFGVITAGATQLHSPALSPARSQRLALIAEALDGIVRQTPAAAGAWVERKPVAAVLHTRLVASPNTAQRLNAAAREVAQRLGGHLLEGKNVLEVAVVPAGKAGALRRLRDLVQADRMVFAGDDVTDELALRTITPPDIGIKVGPGQTAAQCRLDSPADLAGWLAGLADRLGAPPE